MKKLSVFLVLAILCSFFSVQGILGQLNADQAQRLFISNEIFNSLPPVLNQAWDIIKDAETNGRLLDVQFQRDVLWNDILMQKLKPIHEELKKVDTVVSEHRPSKYLNEIINLLDLPTLKNASDYVSHAKQLALVDFWREAWVKLSSILIQMHHKYDWIFDHAYKEGYPVKSDHELEDDFFTLLRDKWRFHYTWLKIDNEKRGTGDERYSQTYDEVAGFAKITTTGKKIENNLFVGLRVLLKMHPEVIGPYRGVDTFNDSRQCLGDQEYVGIQGLDYEIPIYVLLYILNAEMKYYLLRNFAEMQQCVVANKCNLKIVPLLEKHLKTYYKFYYDEMIKAFKAESDPIMTAPPQAWRWRCDPPPSNPQDPSGKRNYSEGVNFERFYDFDTSFMAEERNLSLTQTCRDSCDLYDGAFSSIPCEEDGWKCLESDDAFDCWERKKKGQKCPDKNRPICPNNGLQCVTTRIKNAKVCKGQTDNRYIEYIESDGKRFRQLGEKTECNTPMEKFRSAQMAERSGITKFEPQQCEVCLCKCYEPLGTNSHRYVSVVPQFSNITANRVVAGLRFVKVKNQIHVMIADADLNPQGNIDGFTIHWNDPPPVDANNLTQVFRLGREAKNVLLDDIVTPLGYAITGIRFKPIHVPFDRTYETEMVLQLHVTALDGMGQLIPSDSGWVFNFNDSRFRTEINIEDSVHPVHAIGPSRPLSKTNQFLKVQGSSLKKDAGQTPFPFFDSQEVKFPEDKMTVLRGVGIYYKSISGFGGFLAFRMISEILSDLPPDPRFNLWKFVQMEERRLDDEAAAVVTTSAPTLLN